MGVDREESSCKAEPRIAVLWTINNDSLQQLTVSESFSMDWLKPAAADPRCPSLTQIAALSEAIFTLMQHAALLKFRLMKLWRASQTQETRQRHCDQIIRNNLRTGGKAQFAPGWILRDFLHFRWKSLDSCMNHSARLTDLGDLWYKSWTSCHNCRGKIITCRPLWGFMS